MVHYQRDLDQQTQIQIPPLPEWLNTIGFEAEKFTCSFYSVEVLRAQNSVLKKTEK